MRINKDLIREMLHFNKFTGYNESLTRAAARMLAKEFLRDNVNVIIDDTNYNESTLQSWKDLALEMNAKIKVDDMETPWQLCCIRDNEREKSVGNNVIKNMALAAGEVSGKWILCDIDGTIANCEHRKHFLEGEKKDWTGFFSEMANDSVIQSTHKLIVDFYNQGYGIIFISARPEDYRDVTLKWLEKHYLTFAWTVIMRRSGDKRPDVEVKQDLLNKHFPDKSTIHKVIDDRPSVIRMWKENGLDVIDVGDGVEF